MKKINLNNKCVGQSFEDCLREIGVFTVIDHLAKKKIDLIDYYDEQNNLDDDY